MFAWNRINALYSFPILTTTYICYHTINRKYWMAIWLKIKEWFLTQSERIFKNQKLSRMLLFAERERWRKGQDTWATMEKDGAKGKCTIEGTIWMCRCLEWLSLLHFCADCCCFLWTHCNYFFSIWHPVHFLIFPKPSWFIFRHRLDWNSLVCILHLWMQMFEFFFEWCQFYRCGGRWKEDILLRYIILFVATCPACMLWSNMHCLTLSLRWQHFNFNHKWLLMFCSIVINHSRIPLKTLGKCK